MVAQHTAEQLESQVGREMLHPQGLPPGECPHPPRLAENLRPLCGRSLSLRRGRGVGGRLLTGECRCSAIAGIQAASRGRTQNELQRQPLTSNPGSCSVVGFLSFNKLSFHLFNKWCKIQISVRSCSFPVGWASSATCKSQSLGADSWFPGPSRTVGLLLSVWA